MELSFKSNDIVWVKLGPFWWPGEVVDRNDVPEEVTESLKREPVAIVKFFDDDNYFECVKSTDSIFPYNCERKNDFIKKGMDAFRAKNPKLATFPKDVVAAEVKTGGDVDILSNPMFAPERKRTYGNDVLGTPSPKKRKQIKKTRPVVVKRPVITHRRFLGYNDYVAHVLIDTTPEEGKTEKAEEPEQPETAVKQTFTQYNCPNCQFSSDSIGILMQHIRVGYHRTTADLNNSITKGKKKKKPIGDFFSEDETEKPKRKYTKKKQSSAYSDADTPKRKYKKKTDVQKTTEKEDIQQDSKNETEESLTLKVIRDIKIDVVADWDDDDEEEVGNIILDIEESVQNDSTVSSATLNETNISADDTILEASTAVVESALEISVDLPVDDESVDEVKKAPEISKSPNETEENKIQEDKNEKEADISCFDFDEDEEEAKILPASGRKIPRVIPITDKRKSFGFEDDLEMEKEDEEAEQRRKILEESEELGKTVEKALGDKEIDELDKTYQSLMEETSKIDLPDVPNLLKPEQNFHSAKTVKYPDKNDEATSVAKEPADSFNLAEEEKSTEETATDSINEIEVVESEKKEPLKKPKGKRGRPPKHKKPIVEKAKPIDESEIDKLLAKYSASNDRYDDDSDDPHSRGVPQADSSSTRTDTEDVAKQDDPIAIVEATQNEQTEDELVIVDNEIVIEDIQQEIVMEDAQTTEIKTSESVENDLEVSEQVEIISKESGDDTVKVPENMTDTSVSFTTKPVIEETASTTEEQALSIVEQISEPEPVIEQKESKSAKSRFSSQTQRKSRRTRSSESMVVDKEDTRETMEESPSRLRSGVVKQADPKAGKTEKEPCTKRSRKSDTNAKNKEMDVDSKIETYSGAPEPSEKDEGSSEKADKSENEPSTKKSRKSDTNAKNKEMYVDSRIETYSGAPEPSEKDEESSEKDHKIADVANAEVVSDVTDLQEENSVLVKDDVQKLSSENTSSNDRKRAKKSDKFAVDTRTSRRRSSRHDIPLEVSIQSEHKSESSPASIEMVTTKEPIEDAENKQKKKDELSTNKSSKRGRSSRSRDVINDAEKAIEKADINFDVQSAPVILPTEEVSDKTCFADSSSSIVAPCVPEETLGGLDAKKKKGEAFSSSKSSKRGRKPREPSRENKEASKEIDIGSQEADSSPELLNLSIVSESKETTKKSDSSNASSTIIEAKELLENAESLKIKHEPSSSCRSSRRGRKTEEANRKTDLTKEIHIVPENADAPKSPPISKTKELNKELNFSLSDEVVSAEQIPENNESSIKKKEDYSSSSKSPRKDRKSREANRSNDAPKEVNIFEESTVRSSDLERISLLAESKEITQKKDSSITKDKEDKRLTRTDEKRQSKEPKTDAHTESYQRKDRKKSPRHDQDRDVRSEVKQSSKSESRLPKSTEAAQDDKGRKSFRKSGGRSGYDESSIEKTGSRSNDPSNLERTSSYKHYRSRRKSKSEQEKVDTFHKSDKEPHRESTYEAMDSSYRSSRNEKRSSKSHHSSDHSTRSRKELSSNTDQSVEISSLHSTRHGRESSRSDDKSGSHQIEHKSKRDHKETREYSHSRSSQSSRHDSSRYPLVVTPSQRNYTRSKKEVSENIDSIKKSTNDQLKESLKANESATVTMTNLETESKVESKVDIIHEQEVFSLQTSQDFEIENEEVVIDWKPPSKDVSKIESEEEIVDVVNTESEIKYRKSGVKNQKLPISNNEATTFESNALKTDYSSTIHTIVDEGQDKPINVEEIPLITPTIPRMHTEKTDMSPNESLLVENVQEESIDMISEAVAEPHVQNTVEIQEVTITSTPHDKSAENINSKAVTDDSPNIINSESTCDNEKNNADANRSIDSSNAIEKEATASIPRVSGRKPRKPSRWDQRPLQPSPEMKSIWDQETKVAKEDIKIAEEEIKELSMKQKIESEQIPQEESQGAPSLSHPELTVDDTSQKEMEHIFEAQGSVIEQKNTEQIELIFGSSPIPKPTLCQSTSDNFLKKDDVKLGSNLPYNEGKIDLIDVLSKDNKQEAASDYLLESVESQVARITHYEETATEHSFEKLKTEVSEKDKMKPILNTPEKTEKKVVGSIFDTPDKPKSPEAKSPIQKSRPRLLDMKSTNNFGDNKLDELIPKSKKNYLLVEKSKLEKMDKALESPVDKSISFQSFLTKSVTEKSPVTEVATKLTNPKKRFVKSFEDSELNKLKDNSVAVCTAAAVTPTATTSEAAIPEAAISIGASPTLEVENKVEFKPSGTVSKAPIAFKLKKQYINKVGNVFGEENEDEKTGAKLSFKPKPREFSNSKNKVPEICTKYSEDLPCSSSNKKSPIQENITVTGEVEKSIQADNLKISLDRSLLHERLEFGSKKVPTPQEESTDTDNSFESPMVRGSSSPQLSAHEVHFVGDKMSPIEFTINTNLSNLGKTDGLGDLASLVNLPALSSDFPKNLERLESPQMDDSKTEIITKNFPLENKKEEPELVSIDGNLTVFSEKELAEGQVEITASMPNKKPVTLMNFSMDFSDDSTDASFEAFKKEKLVAIAEALDTSKSSEDERKDLIEAPKFDLKRDWQKSVHLQPENEVEIQTTIESTISAQLGGSICSDIDDKTGKDNKITLENILECKNFVKTDNVSEKNFPKSEYMPANDLFAILSDSTPPVESISKLPDQVVKLHDNTSKTVDHAVKRPNDVAKESDHVVKPPDHVTKPPDYVVKQSNSGLTKDKSNESDTDTVLPVKKNERKQSQSKAKAEVKPPEVNEPVVIYNTVKTSTVTDMCDLEDHIPSQIVYSKNAIINEDVMKVAGIASELTKDSALQNTELPMSKLLSRLTSDKGKDETAAKPAKTVENTEQVKEVDMKSFKLDTNATKTLIKAAIKGKTVPHSNLAGKVSNKAIILSEKIIRPARQSPTILNPSIKRSYEDVEEIKPYIIAKTPRQDTKKESTKSTIVIPKAATPLSSKPALNLQSKQMLSNLVRQGGQLRPSGKAKILNQTIIRQAGEVYQSKVPATTEDNIEFDINSMPIVLSDEILTPESLENMPIVLEDNIQKTTQNVGENVKVVLDKKMPSNNTKILNKTLSMPTSLQSQNVRPMIKKSIIPKILQTPGTSQKIIKHSLSTMTTPKSKYIVLPDSLNKPSPIVKKTNTIRKSIPATGTSSGVQNTSSDSSGHKIMIVTNHQGQQQRLLLTPAHQKLIGIQLPKAKTMLKGAIPPKLLVTRPQTNSPNSVGVTSKLQQTQSVTSPKLVKAPIGSSQINTQQVKLAPQRKTQKVYMPGQQNPKPPQQKTILIKNQHGQTVRKIQGTDDALLDKQVAEQLEAIKVSSMKAQKQQELNAKAASVSRAPPIPTKRSFIKRPEFKQTVTTKPVASPSVNAPSISKGSEATPPPLAPIKTDNKMEEAQKTSTESSKLGNKPSDRPLNQLVIQDNLGNQTTITEGQILALPSETVDGQPQSYMLVTLDETGNLTPLNNEALMSLDPSFAGLTGGDLSNMVLQVDPTGSKDGINQTAQLQAVIPTTAAPKQEVVKPEEVPVAPKLLPPEAPLKPEPIVTQPPVEQPQAASAQVQVTCNINGETGQQIILTGDPIATQKFLDSLTEGNTDLANILATAEGSSFLIQADGQQILINPEPVDSHLLQTNVTTEHSEQGNPMFPTHPMKNQDILAAALADTDVFQPDQSKIHTQLSPGQSLFPINVGGVLETSLTLNSPIMTPLEVPSTNSKRIPDDEAGILTTHVPKNVDLPITITDPNISQTVSNQQVLMANELHTNLELSLPISESAISSVTSEMSSPSFGYSLPSLDVAEHTEISQKSFSSSMPLLTEDIEESPRLSTKTIGMLEDKRTPVTLHTVEQSENQRIGGDGAVSKESLVDSFGSRSSGMVTSDGTFMEEGLCTLGGEMCSSLSEPPPEMFDIPMSTNQTTDSFTDENSIEIPVQPRIVADFKDAPALSTDVNTTD